MWEKENKVRQYILPIGYTAVSYTHLDVYKRQAFSWNGKLEYEGRLKDLARTACDNGADEIFICDRSFSDEDHEAVIGAIKETARTVDEPILAGGRIKMCIRDSHKAVGQILEPDIAVPLRF